MPTRSGARCGFEHTVRTAPVCPAHTWGARSEFQRPSRATTEVQCSERIVVGKAGVKGSKKNKNRIKDQSAERILVSSVDSASAREQKFWRRLSPPKPDMPPSHLLRRANPPNCPVKFLKRGFLPGNSGAFTPALPISLSPTGF